MSKQKIYSTAVLILVLTSLIFTFSPILHGSLESENIGVGDLNTSTNLEGSENIVITDLNKRVNVSNYGAVDMKEYLTFKNQNDFPVEVVYVGISQNRSNNLISYSAKGVEGDSLEIKRNNLIIDDFELFSIYLNSPLLPQQSERIVFYHTYQNILAYPKKEQALLLDFVYSLVPYRITGDINTIYKFPSSAQMARVDWGQAYPPATSGLLVEYDLEEQLDLTQLDPFLENLEERKLVTLVFNESKATKIEINDLNREIRVSPWGTIKVKEEYLVQNYGTIPRNFIAVEVPGNAKGIYVYDELGEIQGTEIRETVRNTTDVRLNLGENRISLNPNSKFEFIIKYSLPFEKYSSMDWFKQSIKINVLTSQFEFLNNDQTTRIYLEGITKITFLNELPDSIEKTQTETILVYDFNTIGPSDRKLIQCTYIIDVFDLLLRPVLFILLFASISALLVLYTKRRMEGEAPVSFRKQNIPVTEIREFCSLYDEMNALVLEMRRAEEEVKRKKISKKKYRNIIDKNNSRIENIKKELKPFKQELIETDETFKNIVKKLEVLEAERVSIDDGLKLLQTRYRRGKLPSKAAYEKLLNNFLKRRKKIDRTIDKLIQQLRSYLI
jgi:hypothetical protein